MSINPEIAERIQGGRFVLGISGNPAGKPRGARARATRLAEQQMADDAEAVVRAVIDAAAPGGVSRSSINANSNER
jgi:hypothetical protein